MTDQMISTARKVAQQFVERAKALGMKGKKRDDAAMEYFCGACTALEQVGHADLDHMMRVTVLLVSPRG